MNVLHFNPFNQLSGSNRSMLTLAAQQAKSRPTFAVVREEGALADAMREAGVEVATLFPPGGLPASRLARWPRFTSGLRSAIKQWDIDILHSHSAMGNRYCRPATLLNKVRLVTHQRDNYRRDYFHLGLGLADRIISISDWVHSQLPPALQAKSRVIYNAVALPSDEQLESDDKSPEGPLRIGLAGRCEVPDKGADIYLDAVLPLLEQSDIEVSIWGMPDRGSSNPFACELWRRLDCLSPELRARCDIQPFRKDVDTFYRKVDVVVVPSRFAEPFGRMAIEAMAWQDVVVAADHGGLSEIIDHERTGLLATPLDPGALRQQIERLIQDPQLRHQLSTAGRRVAAERFSPEQHCAEVEKVYQELLQ